MKSPISISSPVIAGSCIAALSAISTANAQVNVTQFHNHDSRNGLYVDTAFTLNAAANLTRDLNFDGTIVGDVLAQPLYLDDGPGGRPTIIAATESNNVYALDALDGSVIWERNMGDPVLEDDLTCHGNIGPYGITGTPIIDLASRALFFNAMITPDGGNTKKHFIFSLNVDTGDINPGWPVDVGEVAIYNGMTFTPSTQAQRPALGIVDNILYVPYGSFLDHCVYHGWLVGVPINNPGSVMAWATDAVGGAIWGVGGVASDGKNPFVTTGNTYNPPTWGGGEAVIRFQPGPIFSGDPSDYWAPLNWLRSRYPGTSIWAAAGRCWWMFPAQHLLIWWSRLARIPTAICLIAITSGGSVRLSRRPVVSPANSIIQAAATYRTDQSTYVAFRASKEKLSAFRITATNPPTIVNTWSATRSNGGCGSPFVTTTDGTSNPIVWVVGTAGWGIEGDQQLHGYDGETGAIVYAGGGPNELIPGTHSYSTTGIVARGRIYIAGDNKVYAFVPVPEATPTPTPTPTSTPTPTTPTPTSTPRPTPTPRPRPNPPPRPTPPR